MVDLGPILAAVLGPMLLFIVASVRYQHVKSTKTHELITQSIDKAEAKNLELASTSPAPTGSHGTIRALYSGGGIHSEPGRWSWLVGTRRRGGPILPTQLRQDLLTIIKERGYRRLDEPIKLASGAWSSDFIDGKEALAEWRHLRLACEAIVEAVTDAGHRFDAVGGLTMGADALAVGIAAVSDCRWFFVRKEAKQRGTRRWVEGAQIGSGDRILLVDDAVTTGGSIFKALDIVDQTGAETVAAVTLVDRTGLAGPQFEQRGIGYYPMVTYESLGIERVEPVGATTAS